MTTGLMLITCDDVVLVERLVTLILKTPLSPRIRMSNRKKISVPPVEVTNPPIAQTHVGSLNLIGFTGWRRVRAI